MTSDYITDRVSHRSIRKTNVVFDFVIADIRPIDSGEAVDIGVKNGKIAAIEQGLPKTAKVVCGHRQLAFCGFSECHLHLDKALILDRCSIADGTLEEAIRTVAKAKSEFTECDVYKRAAQVLDMACRHGVMQLRTFAEVDAHAGLRSFRALKQIKEHRRDTIEVEICAFAQDGTTGTEAGLNYLISALEDGADLVGGCPYTDINPVQHISDVFDLAERFGVPVDFHLDFSLDPANTHLPQVIAETRKRCLEGRVTLGHVTTLSAMTQDRVKVLAAQLAEAGISVVALPATDLFLMGRDSTHLIPRGIAPLELLAKEGVNVAVASNNILNPFTPSGDCNPLRMVELYMHAAQLRTGAELRSAFNMVTSNAAKVMGKKNRLEIGKDANIVLIDAVSPDDILRRGIGPSSGWFKGQKTFERPFVRNLPKFDDLNYETPRVLDDSNSF